MVTQDIANGREERLLNQEFVRRTSNANRILKTKIEQLREKIQILMDQYENNKRSNFAKQGENDALTADIEQTMKIINILESQNRELENELEMFV